MLKLNGSSVDGAFDDVRCFKVVIFLVRCAVYFAGAVAMQDDAFAKAMKAEAEARQQMAKTANNTQ